jgi:hypothetical protein
MQRKFTWEDLEKMDFAQLILLKDTLRLRGSLHERLELDQWIEGYIFKNAGKPEMLIFTDVLSQQAAQASLPQPTKCEAPAINPQRFFTEKLDIPAKNIPERKSVLEEFFEEQENSWCPII